MRGFAFASMLACAFISNDSLGAPKVIRTIELEKQKLVVEELKGGRNAIWGMAFDSSDGSLYVTYVTGQLAKIDAGTGAVVTQWQGPEVVRKGQGGLLDIQLHPEFGKNSQVFVSYSKPMGKGKATTAVARARLVKGQTASWKDIFVAEPAVASDIHFGSRLAFDKKGFLFISVGERGQRENSQDLTNHLGKVIRLKEDGAVPQDNPFAKEAGKKPEIWSYGHRNPQGLSFDSATGGLYEMEHGPQGGDEINLIKKGANYGWPVITFGKEYGSGENIGEGGVKSGIEAPLKQFTPSIAPSGLIVYSGKLIPEWKGFLIAGALAHRHVNLVKLEAQGKHCERQILVELSERFRAVAESPTGSIFASTDSGKLFRIRPHELGSGRSKETGQPASCSNYKEL